jgi:hypothetical protein
MHHTERSVNTNRSLRRGGITDDQPEQGGLPNPIRADERNPVTIADVEPNVAEKFIAARKTPSEMADGNRSHPTDDTNQRQFVSDEFSATDSHGSKTWQGDRYRASIVSNNR